MRSKDEITSSRDRRVAELKARMTKTQKRRLLKLLMDAIAKMRADIQDIKGRRHNGN